MIAVPKGDKITTADFANFEAFLEGKVHSDNPLDRWYLLGPFPMYTAENVEPSSETATNQQTRFTSLGSTGFSLGMWKGGTCAYKVLLKFHQSQDRFDFFIVTGNILVGVKTTDGAGGDAMRGISMAQVFTKTIVFAEGANGTKYDISFKIGDTRQIRELLTYYQMTDGTDIEGIMKGIVDVDLTGAEITGAPAGDFLVRAIASCGGLSLGAIYGTELSAPSAWSLTNAATGATIPITSVTTQGDQFVITGDSTAPPYPTSGNSVALKLKPLSVLEPLGVEGFESNTLVMPVA
jgi:hypothetical protein